jgi:hypothetical protein
VRETGDFLRQQLVPNLPAQPRSDFLGDRAGSTAVFPVDSNDSNHGIPISPSALIVDLYFVALFEQYEQLHYALSRRLRFVLKRRLHQDSKK